MPDAVSQALLKLSFRKNSDATIRQAALTGDADAFCAALIKSQAKVRKRIEKRFGNAPFAAAWSADLFSAGVNHELCDGMRSFGHSSDLIDRIVATVNASLPVSPAFVLVACEAMLRYPDGFSNVQLVTVFSRLSEITATEICFALPPDAQDGPDIVPSIADLVVQAEVPFLMSLVMESQQSARLWRDASAKGLAGCLNASTDTDGTLDAGLARDAGQWMVPFVRMLCWAKSFRQSWADEATLARWLKTLGRLAALLTPGGFICSASATARPVHSTVPSGIELFTSAVRLTDVDGETGLKQYASALAKGGQKRPKPPQGHAKRLIRNIGGQSDWATTALLRSTLHTDADVISADWDQSTHSLHLAALGRKILDGGWTHLITVDGTTCESAGEWVCTCWFSDKEVAFAELESGSSNGMRHVRHVMLAFKEHFAVLTDTVTASSASANLEFESRLALVDGIDAKANSITRELNLQGDGVLLRAVPAWLDDDRVSNASGSFQQTGAELVMRAHGVGGVALPLVIDWHPDRSALDADWTRLTVTEARRPATARQAAAYRVRIGLLQLLLYRSLRRGENLRAVLGYHTANETVYGRVRNTGEIQPLVLVEADA
ncbi:MAG: hypothetical protein P8K08_25400 [Fuerstiella sp.]|jgi:hypothetical protein|nr:hypothetical protein [Fuerstiella sp.]